MQGLISWDTVLQFSFLLVLLGISLILKSSIPFFKKHLVPTALFGGFIGLLLGPEILGWVPFDAKTLENMVYHFMAIGFIAMALKTRETKSSENISNTGFVIILTYIVQAAMGLGITLLLAALFIPGFFEIFGLLLPLSFAQGPGQALSTGTSFAALQPPSKALPNGGNLGLTMATLGFLWAIIGGIPFMNIVRKIYHKEGKTASLTSDTSPDIQQHTSRVPKTVYLDDLTIQAVLIGVCYLLTYLLLAGLQAILGRESTLMRLFWGFQFLFGTLIALGFRGLLDLLKDKGLVKVTYTDNFLLQRISSISFDIMIVASVCAVSIAAIGKYLVPIMILSTVCGIFTMFYSVWIARWLYKEEQMEHAIALYGMFTGTVVTAMALLKEVDPAGKTSVPESLVLGSGFAVIIGIPLMMVLYFPVTAWVQDKPWLYVVTYGVFLVYAAACVAGVVITKRIAAGKRMRSPVRMKRVRG